VTGGAAGRRAATVGLVLAALTVAGCTGGGSAPSASPSPTSAAPTTVAAGTPDTPGLAAEQAWTSPVGDTATYHSTSVSGGRTYVDVGFCAAPGSAAAAVSSYSWALVGRDGRLYRPAAGPGAAPSPAYPDTKLVEGGSCLRGWVGFRLPAGVEVARVAYQPEGSAAPLATWNP
jgi:hypothetical protein